MNIAVRREQFFKKFTVLKKSVTRGVLQSWTTPVKQKYILWMQHPVEIEKEYMPACASRTRYLVRRPRKFI